MIERISDFFPENQRNVWYKWDARINQIREIRIRVNQNIQVVTDKENILEIVYSAKEIDEFFRYICHDSIYAFEEERKQGYIMLEGGHRIGVTGELSVAEDGRYMVNAARYINIRIAHEIKGIGEKVIKYICDGNGLALNTLIISSPGIGKTTLLRDLVRIISDGNVITKGVNTGLVDERGEIAGAYRGIATLDCGKRTDIITGGGKALGIDILVRAFSPKIIAVDEIGKIEDAEAMFRAGVSGCRIIATIHGNTFGDILAKIEMRDIIKMNIFNRFIQLYYDEKNNRCANVLDMKGSMICGHILLQA